MATEQCDVKPCVRQQPFSTVVSVFSNATQAVNTDCSTNLMYLVDEPGLLDITDPDGATLLDTDNRTIQISSVDQLLSFYSKCSRIYFEVKRLFSNPSSDLVRPKYITLAYWDSDSEEMVDVIESIYQCNPCFYSVSHVTYDKNGTLLADDGTNTDDIAAIQLPLANWGADNNVVTFFPIVDKVTLSDVGEQTSVAAQAKQLGYFNSVFVLLNEECPFILDDDTCEPVDSITFETVYGMQHLLAAGVASSHSSSMSNYAYNFKFKPKGGVSFNGISLADLSTDEFFAVQGNNPMLGGVIGTAGHHVNVYYNLGGDYDVFASGTTATGVPIDKVFYRRYINDYMQKIVVDKLVSTDYMSVTDESQLKALLILAIQKFVDQGIIDNSADALDKSEFDEDTIFMQSNGWVILKPVSDQVIRMTSLLTFCYQEVEALDYVQINICGGK